MLLLLAVAALVREGERVPPTEDDSGWAGEAGPGGTGSVHIERALQELPGDLPPALRARLATLVAGTAIAEHLVLRPVVDLRLPDERFVRVRPFVAGVEVRGVDLRLSWHPEDSGILDTDPWPRDWPALAAIAQRACAQGWEGAPLPDASAEDADALESKRWDRLGLQPLFPVLAQPTTRVYLAVETGSGGHPALRVEAGATVTEPLSRLSGSDAAQSFGDLPWESDPAPLEGALWLDLEIDMETGRPASVRDARLFRSPDPAPAQPATVNGRALVFDPDPVTVSGDLSLRDGDAVDHWRTWTELYDLDGSGYLRGPRIEVATDRPPRAWESDGVFDYVSGDPRFEESMAYAHGDRALRLVGERIGAARTRPLTLRVHGTAADNSWYSRPQDLIIYGDGGVDDAEDADIIVHEVAHAIHELLVPGFGGGDTRAISEGFADFWAATLHDDPCVGDWDATSYSPPCLRRCDVDLAYPYDLTGRPHDDGRLWSSTLWDVRERLGAERAETLALLAFLGQSTQATFPEAGAALLAACDRIGLSPDERAVVSEVLGRRGLARRVLVAELDAASPQQSVRLLGDARFLGAPVRGLIVDLDGRIAFSDAGGVGDPHPFPGGFPSIVAAGPATGALEADSGIGVTVTLTFDPHQVEIVHQWKHHGVPALRTRIEWDPGAGTVVWTYVETGPAWPAPVFAEFFAGVHAEPAATSDLVPFGLGEVFRERRAHTGFRTSFAKSHPGLGSISPITGIRFRVERTEEPGADGEPGDFDLRDPGEDVPGLRLSRTGQALAPPRAAGSLAMSTQPNPFSTNTELRLRLREPEVVRIEILDVGGRSVRRELLPTAAGLRQWTWDGRDQAGHAAPSGRYWIRVDTGTRQGTASVLKLR